MKGLALEESIEAGMMMRGEGNVLPLLQAIEAIATKTTRIEGIVVVRGMTDVKDLALEESIEAGMMMRGEGNVLPLLQVIGHIANMITRIEGIIIVTMRGKIVNILTDRDDQTDLMKMEKTRERAQGVL